MSLAVASGLYGIGVKGPEQKRHRDREDAHEQRTQETHELRMDQGEQMLGIRDAEADRRETVWDREDERYFAEKHAKNLSERMMPAMFQLATEHDPSTLFSIYNEASEEDFQINGWNQIKGKDGQPAWQVVTADGKTQVMSEAELFALAKGLQEGGPDAFFQLHEQQLAQRAAAEQGQAEFERERALIREREQARGQRETMVHSNKAAIDQDVARANPEIDGVELGRAGTFLSRALGMEDSYDPERGARYSKAMAAASAVMRSGQQQGMNIDAGTAAHIGYEFTSGELTEADAKAMARAELEDERPGMFADRTRKSEYDEMIEDRARGIMEESRLARRIIEELGGMNELLQDVGQRPGAAAAGLTGDGQPQLGIPTGDEPPAETTTETEPGTSPETAIPAEALAGKPKDGTYVERGGIVYRVQGGRAIPVD